MNTLEQRLVDLETRLDEAERKITSLVEVCSAVSDDTLRMCFALDVMTKALGLPSTPWDVATKMVDLHHAQRAVKEGAVSMDGVDPKQHAESLLAEVRALRDQYIETVKNATVR